MLLNLLRVEGANPEYMIQRSFYQFQQDKYCIYLITVVIVMLIMNRTTLQMKEKKKNIEEQISKMDNIVELIEIPKGMSFPKGLDINQGIADYYITKHDMDKLE